MYLEDVDAETYEAWDEAFGRLYDKAPDAKTQQSGRSAPAAAAAAVPAAAGAAAAAAAAAAAGAGAGAVAAAAATAVVTAQPQKPAVTLNAKQQQAVNNAFSKVNTYLGGEAGTGKSHVYRDIGRLAKEMGIDVQFMSSTVLSADGIGGITPHSFFGVDIHSQPREAYFAAAARDRDKFVLTNKKEKPDWYKTDGGDRAARILRADILLFDEVGRLTTSMFTTMMGVLRIVCDGIRTQLPTIILSGDFMQGLAIRTKVDEYSPPWKHALAKEDAVFLKNCDAWKALGLEDIYFDDIYRQQDREQQELLSAVRMSYITEAMLKRIYRMCVNPNRLIDQLMEERKKDPEGFMPPVFMHCRLREVAEWNKRWLDELKTPEYTAVPQVFLMYRHMRINRAAPVWYITSLYDEHGKHEYSVPANYRPDTAAGESTFVLHQAELNVVRRKLNEAATLCRLPLEPDGKDLRKDTALRALIGKFKMGAPIFTTQNQRRPETIPVISNGTRGRIIATPTSFFGTQTPPAYTAERSSTFLFKEFEPIGDDDYTTHFPITMMHQNDDGKLDPTKVSKIGCVDRFIPLAEEDSKDWRQRRLQLVVRAHPCHLMWADTPQHSIGKQYPRGVIDIDSATTFPNGGGLAYVMMSRYFDLNKVSIVNLNTRAFYSDSDAWWDNRGRDKVVSKLDGEEIAELFEFTEPDPDRGMQGEMRHSTPLNDKRFAELRASS
jgi:hypothetical protein